MTGILSTCVVCGAEVATKACGRCKTLYCSPHCQQEHWNSGHKKQCKKIQRAGGAEQFHADAKFKEAADAAVAFCAAEGVPQDAECFICRSSIEGKGIVSGCACHGGMGLAHLSCLVWQAEVAVNEFEDQGTGKGINKWWKCFDCGQEFHGAVELALGWACWKTYVGRPDTDWIRCDGLGTLGIALRESRPEEALPMLEASLALNRRYWPDETNIIHAQHNLAGVYMQLGRSEDALVVLREIYAKRASLHGDSDSNVLAVGTNVVLLLVLCSRFTEARKFASAQRPKSRASLGPDHNLTLCYDEHLAVAIARDPDAPLADVLDCAVTEVGSRRRHGDNAVIKTSL